tara:strand:+ start:2175 stop:2519 length:345 start_codon:yes stop_codon:yes gene_type:complete
VKLDIPELSVSLQSTDPFNLGDNMPRAKKEASEQPAAPAEEKAAPAKKPGRKKAKKPFALMVYAVGREFELEFETTQARHVEIVRFSQRSPKGMPVTVYGYTFIGPVVLESVDR